MRTAGKDVQITINIPIEKAAQILTEAIERRTYRQEEGWIAEKLIIQNMAVHLKAETEEIVCYENEPTYRDSELAARVLDALELAIGDQEFHEWTKRLNSAIEYKEFLEFKEWTKPLGSEEGE